MKIKTSKELQQERVRQAAVLNGDIDEDDVMEQQPDRARQWSTAL